MRNSEVYEIILKSYQMKDSLDLIDISLSTEECEKILKSGFCQSLSRVIRKHIFSSTGYTKNKLIEVTLLGITHRFLLSELDRFERKLRIIERFHPKDLMACSNIGQYIIEYVGALLLFSEYLDRLYESPEHMVIKKEIINLTLPGNIESLLFTDVLLNKEFCEEFKILSTPGPKALKDPARLSRWTENLLDLIKYQTLSVSVPEGMKTSGLLIDKLIKTEKIPVKDSSYIIKALQETVIYILKNLQEETQEEPENRLSELLFTNFYLALNLIFFALEETLLFFNNKCLLNFITGIQLLSIAKSLNTLMLDRSDLLLQNENIILNNLVKYFNSKLEKGKLIMLIEEEIDNIYLKQEIEEDAEKVKIFKEIIENYKKSIELIDSSRNKRGKLGSFPLLLKAHNIMKIM